MRTTRLPKEPLKKLNLKGPKVSRRKIGSKPNHNVMRAAIRQGVRDIVAQEDKLWMELALKTLDISPALMGKPNYSTSANALERKMLSEAQKWPKDIKLPFRTMG